MSTSDTTVIDVHNPPRRRRRSKNEPPQMRLVLLGSSVSENRLVGNFILGRAAFDGETPPDVVERVGGRLKDRHVIIISSPQLLQKNISDRQITQTVRECVFLSDPGPHVIVLLLKHEPCSAEDQERVEKVLHSFSDESVYQHTMVLTTQESTETSHILQNIIQRCSHRHFSLQRNRSPDDLLQMFEHIVKINDGERLDCAEVPECVKLNLVVCGSDDTLKSSVSDLILQQTDRRSDVELRDHQISVIQLPALIGLSEEEVMRQTHRCVSLCHPGVHAFILIIPDAPLNNEDKAEMEKIQRIFSSRINKHIMILIEQNPENQTEELNEETQSVVQRFGGRHQFIDLNTQVSVLMEKLQQMVEENCGDCFSAETLMEAQMEKLKELEEMRKKIQSLETPLLSQGSTQREDDLRIVLLGKTGVGKSATGNTILSRKAFTAEASQESVTKVCHRETSEINSRNITVIDTPGLFDTDLTNEEIQREISNCIHMILPGPHVFIIVLNLGQRFTKEEATAVEIIQETFGENSLKYTMVLFTRGDFLENKTIEQCLGKPGSALNQLIEACGSRYHVFNNKETGDRTQVTDLLQKIDNMVKENGESYYSCKMFREMERQIQEQQKNILMEKVEQVNREREELMNKHEEEKKKMEEHYDQKRKRREEEFREREEQYKRDIKEREDQERNIREELKREREEWEKQREEERQRREEEERRIKKEQKTWDEHNQRLKQEMKRMKMMITEERQNRDKERKRREEEQKREITEQEKLLRETQDEMRRERETFRHEIEEMRQTQENVEKEKERQQIKHDTEIEKLMNRIEHDRKEREEEYKTLMKEREDLQSKHESEENMMKILMEKMNTEREELSKKHEEEKGRMKMKMEEEQQNYDKERKRREEEFNEREERYKTLLKEKEEIEEKMHEQMTREREEWEKQKEEEKKRRKEEDEKRREKEQKYGDEFNQRLKQKKERMEKERENLQSKHEERIIKIIKEERQSYEKEKIRKEKEFSDREKQYKREMTEKETQVREEIKTEREEWKKQKKEEKKRREQEDKKRREKEKQICDEQIQRLKSEIEGIIREKERIERERQEQLEDLEKRLKEERKMREDQQKTLEEKLKLLEEHHEEELMKRRVEWREEYEREKEKNCSETDLSLQRENQQKNVFRRLHLEDKHYNKLRAADVLQITAHSLQSHESCSEEELIQTFLQKLLMMNYRARYIHVRDPSEHDHTKERDSSKEERDIFNKMSLSNEETSQSEQIHPMDVQMAVFHRADVFLKQLMVTKLSQCQFALPLLVPDPFTRQIEFPLWTFRQITKSWKMKNINNEFISQTQPIYRAQTPMVFFFRFSSVSSSKSQLMNHLINEKHNTFFHRHCPGSSRSRELMDGVVEIAWFCPSGSDHDNFSECVAFCNLHGDAGDHEKQLRILTDMSSVNVVLLPRLEKNDRHDAEIQNLFRDSKPLICLLTDDEYSVTKMRKGKYKIGLKDRNQSDVSEDLRRALNDCLYGSSHTFRLEDVSKHSEIRVDEEDDEDCRRERDAAQKMMSLLEKKDVREIKKSFLPHQGELWHQWCQKNRELHQPRGDEMEMDISRKQTEIRELRQQQHESDISEFMKLFIKEMNSDAVNKMFFLKWLRILLNEHTSADLSALHHKYDEQWSTVLQLKEKHVKFEQLRSEQTELQRISEDIEAVNFGVEHIMREIGQIYESCSSVKKNKTEWEFDYTDLPSLAAEMMISGSPLELMDGDAAHVPLIWISAVLDQLIQKLGDQRVFVLSVLGLQSSGKSTMLNAMFGLEFAVSAGRCTRGALMQLLRVSDEMKTELKFDYILVVDTEGLRSPQLSGRSTTHHDNELATFVVGLANLTLINIVGENPAEMQDILQVVVQMFMRMKEVRLSPSCVFVYQNVSDVTAGQKKMEGRRRLQEKLDEMTRLAAKEEDSDAECFSDAIRFDVQKDVKYFSQLWEGSPPMAPPNPNYCENIQDLKMTIVSHAAKSHGMKPKDFKDRIEDLWEALLSEQFVFSFRNSLEISVYRRLETQYSKWSWSLRSAMMETENKLHNQIENKVIHEIEESDLLREMKTTSEEVRKSMSEFFEKDIYKEILIQWKTSFDIKIKELQESIVRETKSKLNEILHQRDLKKKIDSQRKRHENTLYEKSKELALHLKNKTNDEETLKKEFDLFWDQCVKKIIRDTPLFRDIDIMRDVREILSDVYQSVSVDHWRDSRDILSVQSYSEYVKLKKHSGITGTLTNVFRSVKQMYGFILSAEDEAQIRSLVSDVSQQTDRMIQSFNISKMGYNISYIQQLIDYIKKRITEDEEGPVRYVFKNEFFIDLLLSICKRANKLIIDQHRLFREDNDPVLYVQKKRGEYYSIFQKYCYRSASAAVFGQIICQKLKEPIEQSVYKKTARDIADEIRSNCPSLNGNRSNLEKHILKKLAEEEDFNKYMNYIHNPKDHFKSFIRDEVSWYFTDRFSLSVLPKMKENIELLQQKIMRAAHQSTEHVQENRGDAGLWLKRFSQELSDELIFSEQHLSGVRHDDVEDFRLIEDVMRQDLPALMSDIRRRFNRKTLNVKLDSKFRSDELLIEDLCRCCWVQCPFCKAVCTNTTENHDGDHRVHFHRVTGINGTYYSSTQNLCANICTSLVASDQTFNVSDENFKYRDYRRAGGVYATWSITPDLSEQLYWKWFVYRFKTDLEKYYSKTFEERGKIPEEWRRYSKQDAIESLDENMSWRR